MASIRQGLGTAKGVQASVDPADAQARLSMKEAWHQLGQVEAGQ